MLHLGRNAFYCTITHTHSHTCALVRPNVSISCVQGSTLSVSLYAHTHIQTCTQAPAHFARPLAHLFDFSFLNIYATPVMITDHGTTHEL